MHDLSSIGFKKDVQNTEENFKSNNDQLESVSRKAGLDLHRDEDSHSIFDLDSRHVIPEAPFTPENPIDETNEKISDLHSTIKNESSKSSISSNKWNRTMFIISLCALVISAVALIVSAYFSFLAFNSSNESSTRLEALMIEQNKLLKINITVNKSIKNNSSDKLINTNTVCT